jgi:acetyltransferase-like isoleucine patch superfamily enzyme
MTERVDPSQQPLWRRVLLALDTEVVGLHPRLQAYNVAASLLPSGTGGEIRARMLRVVGFQIGSGTTIEGPLSITGGRGLTRRLVIGHECSIGANSMFELVAPITIGDRVTIEPGVMLLTSTHELDSAEHRAGPLIQGPVTIGDGAWLRARSIVLPNVKIGPGAIVEVGAVVNKDVEAHARVGGIPAAKLELLKVQNGGLGAT